MNTFLVVMLIVISFFVVYWVIVGEKKFKDKLEGK